MRSALVLAVTIVAALSATKARAAIPQITYPGTHGSLGIAPPRITRAPVVDGALNDSIWTQAAVLDSFTHIRPLEGVHDTLGTQALIAYDDENLYVGFRVHDDPRRVQAPVVPRDQIWQGDWVGVSLDTYHDKQRSLFLAANPLGIQMDGIDQDGRDSDMAPDFLYVSKGRLTDGGYEVEMAIPFKTLRFSSHGPVTFGFNAIRDVKRNGTHMYWAPIRKDVNSYHAQLGALEGLAGVSHGRNLEINPTWTGTETGARTGPAIDYADLDSRFGIGAKLGVTSNLIADMAITPDFSQVEADAGVVDVNERFAIFFPEKRPFFLEGVDVFRTPLDLVYTRRIVDPQYGVKLTGRTGRTGIGLLHAMDRSAADAIETLPNAANPYFDRNARYDIARFRRDVLKNSYVGLLLGERVHRDAYNRGVSMDGRLSWLDQYSFTFQGAQSWSADQNLEGSVAQLSPPDRAALDPALLELRGDRRQGTAWRGALARDTRRLNLSLSAVGFSPSFAADMGFIQRTDAVTFEGVVRPHLIPKGNTWFTEWRFPLTYARVYDYGGDRFTDEVISLVTEADLPLNSWIGMENVRRYYNLGGQSFHDIYRRAIWAGSERFRAVRPSALVVWGDQMVFAEARRGRDFYWELSSDLRFSSQLDASLFVRSRTVWRDLNDSRYAQAVIPRVRVSYQFNKELALRWITELRAQESFDVNDASTGKSRTLTPDVLFSYYVRPGTVLYLGYGSLLEGRDLEGLRPAQNSFFTKLSYLWQV